MSPFTTGILRVEVSEKKEIQLGYVTGLLQLAVLVTAKPPLLQVIGKIGK